MGCRVANTLKSLDKACRRRRTESTSTCREKNSRSLSIVTSIGKGETYKLRCSTSASTSALGRKIELRRTRCLSQLTVRSVDVSNALATAATRSPSRWRPEEPSSERTRLKVTSNAMSTNPSGSSRPFPAGTYRAAGSSRKSKIQFDSAISSWWHHRKYLKDSPNTSRKGLVSAMHLWLNHMV